MAALQTDSVWAVGTQTGQGNGSVPLILHWNGIKWGVSSNPAQNSNAVLFSIVRIGNRDLWAAGDVDVSGKVEPLIEHFDGRRWILDKSYVPPSTSILEAITGTSINNLWAGGYTDGGTSPLIERYIPSQHRWVESSTNIGSDIGSMSARSLSDVWAVGPRDGPGLFVERWNGESWRNVQYPRGGSASLYVVNATASTGYAWFAGSLQSGSATSSFIDRYRRGHWEETPFVQVGQLYTLTYDIAPIDESPELWAIGSYGNASIEAYDLAERWTCPAGAE